MNTITMNLITSKVVQNSTIARELKQNPTVENLNRVTVLMQRNARLLAFIKKEQDAGQLEWQIKARNAGQLDVITDSYKQIRHNESTIEELRKTPSESTWIHMVAIHQQNRILHQQIEHAKVKCNIYK